MKAIVQTRYGLPDVLELREVEPPLVGDDDVLIRVHASSVNHGDWVFLTGKPYPVRLLSGLLRPTRPALGMDVAGRVHTVGKNVTRFRPGDDVFGEVSGAYAEYVCAPEARLARKPANLSFEQAAAVPVAALPALQGLRDRAGIRPGHKVLVNGASGGVGTFAVQIARALGAEVTGVCSTRNLAMVQSIGAHRVVDYTRDDFTRTSERYDAVFDLVGSAPLSRCRRILTPTGVYISSVGRTGWSLKAFLASLIPASRVVALVARTVADDLMALTALIEAGALTPVLDRRFTLREVPDALRYQSRGRSRGKSTITIAA